VDPWTGPAHGLWSIWTGRTEEREGGAGCCGRRIRNLRCRSARTGSWSGKTGAPAADGGAMAGEMAGLRAGSTGHRLRRGRALRAREETADSPAVLATTGSGLTERRASREEARASRLRRAREGEGELGVRGGFGRTSTAPERTLACTCMSSGKLQSAGNRGEGKSRVLAAAAYRGQCSGRGGSGSFTRARWEEVELVRWLLGLGSGSGERWPRVDAEGELGWLARSALV
jgi:hypothetical protein